MKYIGHVSSLSDTGDEVIVTITNVRRKGCAGWREYGPSIETHVHGSEARQMFIGREVEITVTPKGRT